jgi:hypothetical protein
MTVSAAKITMILTAVLLAILLWFNVVSKKQYEYELTLAVTSIDLPSTLAPVNPMPESLTVRILADGRKLMRNDWKEAGLRIRASRLKRGTQTLDLNLETVSLVRPDRVTLLELLGPGSISVNLDRIDTVLRPVVSRAEIIPEDGYAIVPEGTQISPRQTLVIGPGLLVKQIDTIYTEHRVMERVKGPVHLPLDLVEPAGYYIRLGHDSATVDVQVEKAGPQPVSGGPVSMQSNCDHSRSVEFLAPPPPAFLVSLS